MTTPVSPDSPMIARRSRVATRPAERVTSSRVRWGEAMSSSAFSRRTGQVDAAEVGAVPAVVAPRPGLPLGLSFGLPYRLPSGLSGPGVGGEGGGSAVRGEEGPFPFRGLFQETRLDVVGGIADQPQHRGVGVVAQAGQVEYGLDAAAERVADGGAGAGERGETVGEVFAAEDVDGSALGEGGADAVGARGGLGGAEAGGEVDLVEAGEEVPVAAVPLHHAGLSVAEHDAHAHVREGGGEPCEHGVGGAQEGFLQGQVGGVGAHQPVGFQPGGTAALPGVEHRVPDIRVDPRAGQKALVGIDETADVVPGDGQRDHFPRLWTAPPRTATRTHSWGLLPGATTVDPG